MEIENKIIVIWSVGIFLFIHAAVFGYYNLSLMHQKNDLEGQCKTELKVECNPSNPEIMFWRNETKDVKTLIEENRTNRGFPIITTDLNGEPFNKTQEVE